MPSETPAPAAALLARMASAANAEAAVDAFEAGFFTQPAFAGAALLEQAAIAYDGARRPHPARLLRALARQGTGGGVTTPTGNPDADAVLAAGQPVSVLLERLQHLSEAGDFTAAATLFEAALAHLPPLDEYWVHFRMSTIYAELGRANAAFLMASTALQFEPISPTSLEPARRIAARLLMRGAWPALAALQARWQAANPTLELLSAPQRGKLAAHAPALAPAENGRRDRPLVPASQRPALRLGVVGVGFRTRSGHCWNRSRVRRSA